MPVVASTPHGGVWRVGFGPHPWAWSGWEWASNGRFNGRWDDRDGNFRTVYAGSTLKACLMEVLARFRPDPVVSADLNDIDVASEDAILYPSAQPGRVPYSWCETRLIGRATLAGQYCDVTDSQTIAALRPRFLAVARELGLTDFDGAAVRIAWPRLLTQSIATDLYTSTELNGVRFNSRLGDDLELWAIFEKPGDPAISPVLTNRELMTVSPELPDVRDVFNVFNLVWDEG